MIKLVREGKLLGYQIALEIGFREVHSFYRWVKQAFGVSFRELCRQQRHGLPLHPSHHAESDLPQTDEGLKNQDPPEATPQE